MLTAICLVSFNLNNILFFQAVLQNHSYVNIFCVKLYLALLFSNNKHAVISFTNLSLFSFITCNKLFVILVTYFHYFVSITNTVPEPKWVINVRHKMTKTIEIAPSCCFLLVLAFITNDHKWHICPKWLTNRH